MVCAPDALTDPVLPVLLTSLPDDWIDVVQMKKHVGFWKSVKYSRLLSGVVRSAPPDAVQPTRNMRGMRYFMRCQTPAL